MVKVNLRKRAPKRMMVLKVSKKTNNKSCIFFFFVLETPKKTALFVLLNFVFFEEGEWKNYEPQRKKRKLEAPTEETSKIITKQE